MIAYGGDWNPEQWLGFPGGWGSLPLSILLGVAAATVLRAPWVRGIFHWAVEPGMAWAFTPLRGPA